MKSHLCLIRAQGQAQAHTPEQARGPVAATGKSQILGQRASSPLAQGTGTRSMETPAPQASWRDAGVQPVSTGVICTRCWSGKWEMAPPLAPGRSKARWWPCCHFPCIPSSPLRIQAAGLFPTRFAITHSD